MTKGQMEVDDDIRAEEEQLLKNLNIEINLTDQNSSNIGKSDYNYDDIAVLERSLRMSE